MLIYGKQPVRYVLERHRTKVQSVYLAKELDKKEYNQLMRSGVK